MIEILEKYCTPLLFMGLVGISSSTKFNEALQENERVVASLYKKLDSLEIARLAIT